MPLGAGVSLLPLCRSPWHSPCPTGLALPTSACPLPPACFYHLCPQRAQPIPTSGSLHGLLPLLRVPFGTWPVSFLTRGRSQLQNHLLILSFRGSFIQETLTVTLL